MCPSPVAPSNISCCACISSVPTVIVPPPSVKRRCNFRTEAKTVNLCRWLPNITDHCQRAESVYRREMQSRRIGPKLLKSSPPICFRCDDCCWDADYRIAPIANSHDVQPARHPCDRGLEPANFRLTRELANKDVSACERQPRRAASMTAMSIFFIVIIAVEGALAPATSHRRKRIG